MPWKPSFDEARPDPRLDAVRGRAAELLLDGEVAGHLLVETEYGANRSGGRLWWQRWETPHEFAIVLTDFGNDHAHSAWVQPEDFTVFDQWETDGFDEHGTRFTVRWLDEDASSRVHTEVFGHHH
jgi:hypothetical protein